MGSAGLNLVECEVCGIHFDERQGGSIGHVDVKKRVYFCKEHFSNPDIWKPVAGAVFDDEIAATKQATRQAKRTKNTGS